MTQRIRNTKKRGYPIGLRWPIHLKEMVDQQCKKQGRTFSDMVLYLTALGLHYTQFDLEEYITDPDIAEANRIIREKGSIPKKIRFQVLERDNFTCKYCGRKAPDVPLWVDHVIPESKGGKLEMSNLVTACEDCNRGKHTAILKAVV